MHCSLRGALEPYSLRPGASDAKKRKHKSNGDAGALGSGHEHVCQNAFDTIMGIFRGRDTGVEELEARTDVLRCESGKVKVQGASSARLSNSAHCDIFDTSRSYAMWTVNDPSLPPPKSWFLLFPANGLAIELGDGVCVSWDGRCHYHCSAVADVDPRLITLSFFCGVRRTTCNVARRLREWEWASESRRTSWWLSSLPLTAWDRVWYRRDLGGDAFRRESATVLSIGELGQDQLPCVRLAFGREGYRPQSIEEVSMSCLTSSLVRAGSIQRSNELVGEELVGKRVSVFWPADDACFDGRVCAYDSSRQLHTISYDDGMHLEELLGSEDSPSYRVI